MEKEPTKLFKTNDTHLVAYLRTLGFHIDKAIKALDVDKYGSTVEIVHLMFYETTQLQEAIYTYIQGQALVEPKNYIKNFKFLSYQIGKFKQYDDFKFEAHNNS